MNGGLWQLIAYGSRDLYIQIVDCANRVIIKEHINDLQFWPSKDDIDYDEYHNSIKTRQNKIHKTIRKHNYPIYKNNNDIINNFNRDICCNIGKFLTYEDKINFIKVAKFINNNMKVYKNIYPINRQEFSEGMKMYFNKIRNNIVSKWLEQINSSPNIFIKLLLSECIQNKDNEYDDVKFEIKTFIKTLSEGKAFYRKCTICLKYHRTNLLYNFDIVLPLDILPSKINTGIKYSNYGIIEKQKSKKYRRSYQNHKLENYSDDIKHKKVKIMNQTIPTNIKFKRNYR
jgi:hypothetical protein